MADRIEEALAAIEEYVEESEGPDGGSDLVALCLATLRAEVARLREQALSSSEARREARECAIAEGREAGLREAAEAICGWCCDGIERVGDNHVPAATYGACRARHVWAAIRAAREGKA